MSGYGEMVASGNLSGEGTDAEVHPDYRLAALKAWGLSIAEAVPCVVCGTVGFFELHHILFRSQGGTNEPSNLAPICRIDHEDIHQERLRLIRIEGTIVTFDMILEQEHSRTPWPPVSGLMEEIGQTAMEAESAIRSISGRGHAMIRTQLPDAIALIHDIGKVSESEILDLCHEVMQRAPRRQRIKAAEALAVELTQRGIPMSETLVRSFAGQYDVRELVGEELWNQTPSSVRVKASWMEPEQGENMIHAYHERPRGMTIKAFIEAHRETGEGDPFEASYCESCKGDGRVECESCNGTGRKPE